MRSQSGSYPPSPSDHSAHSGDIHATPQVHLISTNFANRAAGQIAHDPGHRCRTSTDECNGDGKLLGALGHGLGVRAGKITEPARVAIGEKRALTIALGSRSALRESKGWEELD